MAPINHLPHTFGIADAEVVLRADGEDRLQNAGHQLIGT